MGCLQDLEEKCRSSRGQLLLELLPPGGAFGSKAGGSPGQVQALALTDQMVHQQTEGFALLGDKEGRPVMLSTRLRRERLKQCLLDWLAHQGYVWTDVGNWVRKDVTKLNEVLVQYGRWLYDEGFPYYHFSECLNLITSEFPIVRRLLQQAWDLAFAWQREEPPTHHSAMPWQILAAALSIALMWGWTRVAGVCALCWGGLARVGEVLSARRAHLVLPEDVLEQNSAVHLSGMEPKTRFRAARHQCLKVDQPQLVNVIQLAFRGLGPNEKLWDMSASTMRARFDKLIHALGLQKNLVEGVKDFDLGSLRAGGATWLMQVTESPDLVRRRGRWITNRVMEIYAQEVGALLYLPRLPPRLKDNVFAWASKLDEMLVVASQLADLGVLPCHWHALLRQGWRMLEVAGR